MTAPSIGCKDLLVTAGLGAFGNAAATWPIYISKLPTEPDNCITLADVGGLAPEARLLIDYPDVSVTIRSRDYAAGFDQAKAVKDALHGLPPQTINGDWWASCRLITDVTFIGRDNDDRVLFSLTFRLIIEPANVAGDHRTAV